MNVRESAMVLRMSETHRRREGEAVGELGMLGDAREMLG